MTRRSPEPRGSCAGDVPSLALPTLSRGDKPADTGSVAVVPGCLDHHPSQMSVPGLADRSTPPKAADLPELSDDCHGRHLIRSVIHALRIGSRSSHSD